MMMVKNTLLATTAGSCCRGRNATQPLRMFGYTVGSGGFQGLFTGTQVCYSDGPSFARVVGASERRKSKAMQVEFGIAAV